MTKEQIVREQILNSVNEIEIKWRKEINIDNVDELRSLLFDVYEWRKIYRYNNIAVLTGSMDKVNRIQAWLENKIEYIERYA